MRIKLSGCLFLLSLSSSILYAQKCHLSIKGRVLDAATNRPLEFVNVYLEGTSHGSHTDSLGLFHFKRICSDDYHLRLTHIGCEPQTLFIQLKGDTSLTIKLEHSLNILDGITVTGLYTQTATQAEDILNQQSITEQASKNLSNMLTAIAGVRSLKTGTSIAKPIIHGLYGNRITILNNGIAQSGQQWGNDHSPEIDPLVANHIHVVKGVSSLKYPGSNLGSVVLVEPQGIKPEPHLHAKTTYFSESNGLAQSLNFQLQQYSPRLAWKINTTLKKAGDRKTATYFLRNTGSREANLALQLEKKLSQRLDAKLYFSTFNTEIGILRGGHIGNVTDLKIALQRSEPFFTESKFNYSISAPKQVVHHHLLKIETKYQIDESQSFEFVFAGQSNFRREFDIRRSKRASKPTLSLLQWTFFGEGEYRRTFNTETLNMGLQLNLIDNTNKPETDIFPLIPDYIAYELGNFITYSNRSDKWLFEVGARYDFIFQNVVTFSTDIPREILRYDNHYHNFSTSAGFNYYLNDKLTITYNLGYATRNPAINELYSAGLHQGVSGIELGDIGLKPEQSLKTTLGFKSNLRDKVILKTLFYYQNIADYILLNPQKEFRLTIRGAFPVFKYEQIRAQIFGLDFSNQVALSPNLDLTLAYNFIRGDDQTGNQPLINMPANMLTASLNYKILKIRGKKLENMQFTIDQRYVFKQTHLRADQDFVSPPAAYYLTNLKIASELQFDKLNLRVWFQVDNLFDISYRDYLNRQRYFADEWGINIILGLSLNF